MYINLHLSYPIFLSDFNKTYIFSTDFLKTLKYQISLKFFHWEPSCSMRTGGYNEANSHFSQIYERA